MPRLSSNVAVERRRHNGQSVALYRERRPLERLVRRANFATRTNASKAAFTIAERSRELEESRPRHPVAVSIHHHD